MAMTNPLFSFIFCFFIFLLARAPTSLSFPAAHFHTGRQN